MRAIFGRIRHATWEFIKRHVVAVALSGFVISVTLGVGGYISVTRLYGQLHGDFGCLASTLHDRGAASKPAILAPRRFFADLLPLFNAAHLTDRQRAEALSALKGASLHAHDVYSSYVQAQKANPLPSDPNQLCN